MPVDQPLTAAQLKSDIDTAVHDGSGFGKVFTELQQQFISEMSKPAADRNQDMQIYQQAINQELAAQHLPKVDITFGENGSIAVKIGSAEVDVNSPYLDTKTADTSGKSADTTGKSSADSPYWDAHERQKNSDGSSDMRVKQGDSLWKIARHVCEERLGHKMDPSNPDDMRAVAQVTKEIAAAQNPPITIGKDGHAKIKENDSLHIPSEKDSKVKSDSSSDDGEHTGGGGGSDSGKRKSSGKGTDNHTGKGKGSSKRSDAGAGKTDKPGEAKGDSDEPARDAYYGYGSVNTNGRTTDISEPDGSTAKVITDSNSKPNDLELQGGHWQSEGMSGHWQKTGEHKWQNDNGQVYNGDVEVSKDGTLTFTGADNSKQIYHSNGARENLGIDGKPNFVQAHGGAHQHSYTVGTDGKWTANPDGEKFDSVNLDKQGNVIAKQGDITKTMYVDGSQQDVDGKGNPTFIEMPATAHQQSFTKGTDGKWTSDPGNEKFDKVTMSKDGTVTAETGNFKKTYYYDGEQEDSVDGKPTFIQSADGPRQESWTKGTDGKWTANPHNDQKFDDVRIDDNGNIVCKGKDITKTHSCHAEVDTDNQGRMTYMRTSDGKEYLLSYDGNDPMPSKIQGPDDSLWTRDGNYYSHNGTRVRLDIKPGEIDQETSQKTIKVAGVDL